MSGIGQSAPIPQGGGLHDDPGGNSPQTRPTVPPPKGWKSFDAVKRLRAIDTSRETSPAIRVQRIGRAVCESYGQPLTNPSVNLPITGDTANYVTFSTPEITYRQHPNFLYNTLDEVNEIIDMDEQFPEIRLHLIQKPYRSDDDYFIIQSRNIPYDRAFDDLFQRRDYRPVPEFEEYIKILHGHLNRKLQALFKDPSLKFKRTSDIYIKYAHYTISLVEDITQEQEDHLRQNFLTNVVARQGCQEITDWVMMPYDQDTLKKDPSSRKTLIYVKTALRPNYEGQVVDFYMKRGTPFSTNINSPFMVTVLQVDERCLNCKRVGHQKITCRNPRYDPTRIKAYRNKSEKYRNVRNDDETVTAVHTPANVTKPSTDPHTDTTTTPTVDENGFQLAKNTVPQHRQEPVPGAPSKENNSNAFASLTDTNDVEDIDMSEPNKKDPKPIESRHAPSKANLTNSDEYNEPQTEITTNKIGLSEIKNKKNEQIEQNKKNDEQNKKNKKNDEQNEKNKKNYIIGDNEKETEDADSEMTEADTPTATKADTALINNNKPAVTKSPAKKKPTKSRVGTKENTLPLKFSTKRLKAKRLASKESTDDSISVDTDDDDSTTPGYPRKHHTHPSFINPFETFDALSEEQLEGLCPGWDWERDPDIDVFCRQETVDEYPDLLEYTGPRITDHGDFTPKESSPVIIKKFNAEDEAYLANLMGYPLVLKMHAQYGFSNEFGEALIEVIQILSYVLKIIAHYNAEEEHDSPPYFGLKTHEPHTNTNSELLKSSLLSEGGSLVFAIIKYSCANNDIVGLRTIAQILYHGHPIEGELENALARRIDWANALFAKRQGQDYSPYFTDPNSHPGYVSYITSMHADGTIKGTPFNERGPSQY